MSNPVNAIAKTLQEALELWKTYIATREAHYKIKRDKQTRRAINYAEKYILKVKEEGLETDELRSLSNQFFKYNN